MQQVIIAPVDLGANHPVTTILTEGQTFADALADYTARYAHYNPLRISNDVDRDELAGVENLARARGAELDADGPAAVILNRYGSAHAYAAVANV